MNCLAISKADKYKIIALNRISYTFQIDNKNAVSISIDKQTEYIIRVRGNSFYINCKLLDAEIIEKILMDISEETRLSIISTISKHDPYQVHKHPISIKTFEEKQKLICSNMKKCSNIMGEFNYFFTYSTLYTNDKTRSQYSENYNIYCIKSLSQDYFKYKSNHFPKLCSTLYRWLNLKDIQHNDLHSIEKIYITAEAISEIVDKLVLHFYADLVFSESSIIKFKDINKKIFPENISLISAPPNNIKFDREGNLCNKKHLIKNGKIIDLISNEANAVKTKKINPGNVDMLDENKLDHYNLITLIKSDNTSLDVQNKIIKFSNLAITENGIWGETIYLNNGKLCNSNFEVNLFRFLSNIFAVQKTYRWYNNIFCPDVIYYNF